MGRIEKLTLYSLILLLIWGNMVSGLGAGLACPDWPLCFGSFFPEINFPIFMEHGHRVLGLFVTIFFAFLAKERLTFYKGIHKLIPIICSILLAIQIVAGALVVILQLETNITTFHFGNAMGIFILIYTMCLYKNSEELNSISIFTKKNIPYLFLLPLLIYIAVEKGIIISNIIIPLPKFALLLVGSSPANNAKFDLISAFKIISSKMQMDVRIKGIPIKFSKLVILLLDVTFKAMNIAMIIPEIGPITSIVLSGLIDQK